MLWVLSFKHIYKKLNYSLFFSLIERIMLLKKLNVTLFSNCKQS